MVRVIGGHRLGDANCIREKSIHRVSAHEGRARRGGRRSLVGDCGGEGLGIEVKRIDRTKGGGFGSDRARNGSTSNRNGEEEEGCT